MNVCDYHHREDCPTCNPTEPRTRVALAVFRATRNRLHPANGGEHWHTADRLMELLPELKRSPVDTVAVPLVALKALVENARASAVTVDAEFGGPGEDVGIVATNALIAALGVEGL